MITRVGKIARLPYKIREQLNLRMLNGQLGAPLLNWLNELPETKELVADLFASKPITKQNLSEWRHGGYEDWLRHQRRQENFQQMNEQGEELEGDEGPEDLFENFSRLVLAEMAENLNGLHEITNRTERWKRLREISRDLARLQHSYNHSKKIELSFTKWKHEIGNNRQDAPSEEETPENATSARATTNELNAVAPCPATSERKNSPAADPFRRIYHHQCSRGCICKECHPDDGKYPYAQALKDDEETRKPEYWALENNRDPMIINVDCDCPCDDCASRERQRLSRPGLGEGESLSSALTNVIT